MLLRLKRNEPLIRTFGGTTLVGMVLGALIGGVGSRLAMRVLFLTSGTGVRGVVSDDGFRIGAFTAATANLMITGTLIGIIGAFVYLGVRPFLIGPRWLHSVTCGLAAGAVVGALLVHPEGVDFTLLSPTWFAIALFVAIPATFGAAVPPAVEWTLRDEGWVHTAPFLWVASPLLVFLFPPLLLLVGPPAAVVLVTRNRLDHVPRLRRYTQHQFSVGALRTAWLAIAAFGLVALIKDIAVLL